MPAIDDNGFILTLDFTMKLLTGEPLSDVLKNIRNEKEGYLNKYNQDKLLRIFMDVCEAMIYSHSIGIVHLDLKPANIQVSNFGEVSILDWGFAKQLNEESLEDYHCDNDLQFTPISDNLTQAGTIKGTPGYMSPEQATPDDQEPGIHSDIYSLGAILYNILYLSRPYDGLTIQGIIKYCQYISI